MKSVYGLDVLATVVLFIIVNWDFRGASIHWTQKKIKKMRNTGMESCGILRLPIELVLA